MCSILKDSFDFAPQLLHTLESDFNDEERKILPIIIPEAKDWNAINLLSNRQVAKTKRLYEIGIKKTDERTKLELEIDELDKEIDALVYEIYDITDSEKKIMENSLG